MAKLRAKAKSANKISPAICRDLWSRACRSRHYQTAHEGKKHNYDGKFDQREAPGETVRLYTGPLRSIPSNLRAFCNHGSFHTAPNHIGHHFHCPAGTTTSLCRPSPPCRNWTATTAPEQIVHSGTTLALPRRAYGREIASADTPFNGDYSNRGCRLSSSDLLRRFGTARRKFLQQFVLLAKYLVLFPQQGTNLTKLLDHFGPLLQRIRQSYSPADPDLRRNSPNSLAQTRRARRIKPKEPVHVVHIAKDLLKLYNPTLSSQRWPSVENRHHREPRLAMAATPVTSGGRLSQSQIQDSGRKRRSISSNFSPHVKKGLLPAEGERLDPETIWRLARSSPKDPQAGNGSLTWPEQPVQLPRVPCTRSRGNDDSLLGDIWATGSRTPQVRVQSEFGSLQ